MASFPTSSFVLEARQQRQFYEMLNLLLKPAPAPKQREVLRITIQPSLEASCLRLDAFKYIHAGLQPSRAAKLLEPRAEHT